MARASSYHLVSCLGRGGFGEVYLAVSATSGGIQRKRALKLLRADLERQDEAIDRLTDEGRLLSLLDHPAIVQVEGFVQIEGRIGLLMEYIEGSDLRRVLKTGTTLPTTVTMEIVATIADALESAVALRSPETGRPLRLVHRDIKPGNLMLTSYGRIKLLDFGVARSKEIERDTHTRAGEVPMTPGYAAPEVMLQRQQTPAGDVFALGAVAYHCLTGKKLLRKMKLTEMAMLFADPRSYGEWMEERLDQIPHRGLRQLTSDMLAWSPAERPPAHLVRERAEELQSALHGPSLSRWVRRVDLPGPPMVQSDLVGRTVTEEPLPERQTRRPSAPPSSPPTPVSDLRRYGQTLVAPEELGFEETASEVVDELPPPPVQSMPVRTPVPVEPKGSARTGGGLGAGPIVLAVVGLLFALTVVFVLALAGVAALFILP